MTKTKNSFQGTILTEEGRSEFAQLIEEIHLGLVLLASFFFLATLVLPCFIAMERKQPTPVQVEAPAPRPERPPAPKQQPALNPEPSPEPELASEPREESEPAAPKIEAPKVASAAPEVASAAPESAAQLVPAADRLPEPYDTCPVYQPLRRSFSIQSTGLNPYVAGLLEEIQEWRAMARVNRTVGCSGFQNEPMGNFLTRSNSWMYHGPPPPRPTSPSMTANFSKRALPPTPATVHWEARGQAVSIPDRRPPWAKTRQPTEDEEDAPTWARTRARHQHQTWAGAQELAETRV